MASGSLLLKALLLPYRVVQEKKKSKPSKRSYQDLDQDLKLGIKTKKTTTKIEIEFPLLDCELHNGRDCVIFPDCLTHTLHQNIAAIS